MHNVRSLHADDRATVDGIPVTAVHRTLLDYAEVARFQQLRLALDAAERRERFDSYELARLYDRALGRRGLRALKAAVAEFQAPALGRSPSSSGGSSRCSARRASPSRGRSVRRGLPRRRVVAGTALAIELDGYDFHKGRGRFNSDRLQDTKPQLAGCMTIRVTQPRIENEPGELLGDVRRGLARAAASGR